MIPCRYLFNIRTKPDGPVVVIKAMDFFTISTKKMKFELWSRPGSFKDFKGSLDGWEAVAKGGLTGAGPGVYTSIPSDLFVPVDIPGGGGDGGTRAFYLTLKTNDLAYKTGTGDDSDTAIQIDTPELELWEGEVSFNKFNVAVSQHHLLFSLLLRRESYCTPCQTHQKQCITATQDNSWEPFTVRFMSTQKTVSLFTHLEIVIHHRRSASVQAVQCFWNYARVAMS